MAILSKSWDKKLCQVEFAHSHAVNQSIGFSPFQVVYGLILHSPLDMVPISSIVKVHGKVEDFCSAIAVGSFTNL